jgi:hypothetical protein
MTTDTGTTGPGPAEPTHETASTAVDEGRRVAGVAAGEAQGVAADASQQVRSVVTEAVGQVREQLDDQSRHQKDLLAGTMTTFADDLSRMSERGSGLAADVAHEVADRAYALSRHLDGRAPTELLDDVRRFARQRPGTFLVGALAAGMVAGRLLRGTKDAVEAAAAQDETGTPQPAPGGYPEAARPAPGEGAPAPTGYVAPPVGAGVTGSPNGDPFTGTTT